MSTNGQVEVDDTYAEDFRSIFAKVLITARDRKWLDHAVQAATGHASSTIMCDCEAGVDRYVGPGGDESYKMPDGRPGVLVQFHVPRFRKDRSGALEKALLARISQNVLQNVLTCPTTRCFGAIRGVLGQSTSNRISSSVGRSLFSAMDSNIAKNGSAAQCGSSQRWVASF